MTTALEPLIRAWQEGWGRCRQMPEAVELPGALLARVDLPLRSQELIALGDESTELDRLARAAVIDGEATWLTVMTEQPDRVSTVLAGAGLAVPQEHEAFMTTGLPSVCRPRKVPNGYGVHVQCDGAVHRIGVLSRSGAEAAVGSMAITSDGRYAVAHAIATDPHYRRQGLGTLVMGRLASLAADAGAKAGLLVASPEGQRLYTALGWSTLATVVSGQPDFNNFL